jgi:hypothetical protein
LREALAPPRQAADIGWIGLSVSTILRPDGGVVPPSHLAVGKVGYIVALQLVARRTAPAPWGPRCDGSTRREEDAQRWYTGREIHIIHFVGFNLDVQGADVDGEMIERRAGETDGNVVNVQVRPEFDFPDRQPDQRPSQHHGSLSWSVSERSIQKCASGAAPKKPGGEASHAKPTVSQPGEKLAPMVQPKAESSRVKRINGNFQRGLGRWSASEGHRKTAPMMAKNIPATSSQQDLL